MIDQQQRITTLVKDELAKQAVALGLDKSQVGYAVSPTFAPVAGPDGQPGLFYCWVVTITLRVPLVGYPPMLVPVIVPAPLGTLPKDDDFRGATVMGLQQINNGYREILNGDASGKGLGQFAA